MTELTQYVHITFHIFLFFSKLNPLLLFSIVVNYGTNFRFSSSFLSHSSQVTLCIFNYIVLHFLLLKIHTILCFGTLIACNISIHETKNQTNWCMLALTKESKQSKGKRWSHRVWTMDQWRRFGCTETPKYDMKCMKKCYQTLHYCIL